MSYRGGFERNVKRIAFTYIKHPFRLRKESLDRSLDLKDAQCSHGI